MKYVKCLMDKSPRKQRCKICGNYILEGEEFYIVYPENNKKITKGVVHCKEFDKIGNLKEQIKFLELRKTPKFRGLTEEQNKAGELFYEICSEFGFPQKAIFKRTIKCKMSF